MRNSEGITLVALVVTIIVLLILAGVSINLVMGKNGIINKSKEAAKEYEETALNENIEMNKVIDEIDAINSDFLKVIMTKKADFSEDGLYIDNKAPGDIVYPYGPKYIYKGEDPNNYIIFSNKRYRIVNLAYNDTIKILYDGDLGFIEWSNTDNILWNNSTHDLKNKFEAYYTSGIMGDGTNMQLDTSKIEKATWYVGKISPYTVNQPLETDVENERANTYEGYLGLINPTDYVKASENDLCTSIYQSRQSLTIAQPSNNYLHDITNGYWTMNQSDILSAWVVFNTGALGYPGVSVKTQKVKPAMYLKSDVRVIGNGTIDDPYIIVD